VPYWYEAVLEPVPRHKGNLADRAGGQALVVETLMPLSAIRLATARSSVWRGTGTPRGRASSPVGLRGVFLRIHREGTMSAHKPMRHSPGGALTRKQDPDLPSNPWAMISYAIDDTRRTVRICVIGVVVIIAVVVGAVLAPLLYARFRM
jgi:hypothetical protein